MSARGDLVNAKPEQLRQIIRTGGWDKPTAGLAMGYAQANLVILRERYAFDFLLFCQRNPKPCPLLEVIEVGQYRTRFLSKTADIRSDIPKYNIYREGKLKDTVSDITSLWQDDFVSFLLGCSFSFEQALVGAGIPVRHLEEEKIVPMYITNIPCIEAGRMHGPLVVSMRPLRADRVVRAAQITSRYALVHGAPVHVGDPGTIGIRELGRPDFGDAVTVREGEIPVFWACGVTPQAVVIEARLDFCITHTPGHMFISDILNEELAGL
jgi:uncharacterized protein YcsI (UPF0317 family)